MAEFELPRPVRDLVNRHMASLDHVELLLHLRAAPEQWFSVDDLDAALRLERGIIERCLRDLVQADLVRCDDERGRYRYAPKDADTREAVDSLAQMFNERPVTLIRAIYNRPPKALTSFAEAFRLRGPGG